MEMRLLPVSILLLLILPLPATCQCPQLLHQLYLIAKIFNSMFKILGITVILISVLFIIAIQIVVVNKKIIYYNWIDQSNSMTMHSYLSFLDGNWFFKKIDFNKIVKEHPNNEKLKRKIQLIKLGQKFSIILSALIVMNAGVLIYLDQTR
ncbi:hypothetical protein DXN04_30750 [Chitinophaga silvisoli]|uniref:Uncharacterized protein n=2 Tax=Chitinophaga silvisoli TaxID=2291814 RepID=A0A3E1NTI0_9BACT|nr:hypothetical protein DXN04_30750 [Chitinophaga silvisoli]